MFDFMGSHPVLSVFILIILSITLMVVVNNIVGGMVGIFQTIYESDSSDDEDVFEAVAPSEVFDGEEDCFDD